MRSSVSFAHTDMNLEDIEDIEAMYEHCSNFSNDDYNYLYTGFDMLTGRLSQLCQYTHDFRNHHHFSTIGDFYHNYNNRLRDIYNQMVSVTYEWSNPARASPARPGAAPPRGGCARRRGRARGAHDVPVLIPKNTTNSIVILVSARSSMTGL